MDNMQSIHGDTGFLHKQFCSGMKGKRQQVNFTNIQLKLLIFSFSGISKEGNEKVEKYKTPSINGVNKTLGLYLADSLAGINHH